MMDKKSKFEIVARAIWSMLLGATMFTVLGWGIPEIYYRYIDQTVYYQIHSPIEVEDHKIYHPCEAVTFDVTTKSVVGTMGKLLVELDLVESGSEKLIQSQQYDVYLENTDGDISQWKSEQLLPCNLKDGQYYWKGLIRYKVRGIEKTAEYTTETIQVQK